MLRMIRVRSRGATRIGRIRAAMFSTGEGLTRLAHRQVTATAGRIGSIVAMLNHWFAALPSPSPKLEAGEVFQELGAVGL